MKHTVELRLPRLFGKKKDENKPEVTTKVFVDDEVREIPLQVIVGTTLVIGLGVGYLIGFRSGSMKRSNTYIFKD